MNRNKLRGAWGEALAAEYLRRNRYKIEAVGYSCKFGEIDLIASDKQYLVFVEVKLRRTPDFARAMEYVNRAKQDRIRVTASLYLSQYPTRLQPRFDVIEIYAPEGIATASPQIRHLENAFE